MAAADPDWRIGARTPPSGVSSETPPIGPLRPTCRRSSGAARPHAPPSHSRRRCLGIRQGAGYGHGSSVTVWKILVIFLQVLSYIYSPFLRRVRRFLFCFSPTANRFFVIILANSHLCCAIKPDYFFAALYLDGLGDYGNNRVSKEILMPSLSGHSVTAD